MTACSSVVSALRTTGCEIGRGGRRTNRVRLSIGRPASWCPQHDLERRQIQHGNARADGGRLGVIVGEFCVCIGHATRAPLATEYPEETARTLERSAAIAGHTTDDDLLRKQLQAYLLELLWGSQWTCKDTVVWDWRLEGAVGPLSCAR